MVTLELVIYFLHFSDDLAVDCFRTVHFRQTDKSRFLNNYSFESSYTI